MHLRPIVAILTGLSGASVWALVDGVIGTLATFLGAVGAALGIFWGWRAYRRHEAKHAAEMAALETERVKMELEIEKLKQSG